MARGRRGRSRRKKSEKQEEVGNPAIQYVSGDMFAETHKFKAMAFGCHPEGVMRTELTLKFRTKYPDLFDEYKRRCETEPSEFNLGDAMMHRTRDGMTVFVLGTQANIFLALATAEQIEAAFKKMREQMEQENITTLAMPPIGAGLGALQWSKSRRTLERVFQGWDGQIMVYVK